MASTKDHIETVNEAMNAQRKEVEEKTAGLSRIESRAEQQAGKSFWQRLFGK